MLRFILAILVCISMIKLTQKDPVVSFTVGYGFMISFLIYTISCNNTSQIFDEQKYDKINKH